MWMTIAILCALAAAGLYFWWQARWEEGRRERDELRAELDQARETLDHAISQNQIHQQAVFNSMVEGILLLDTNGRVQITNQSVERLFDIKRDIRGLALIEAFRSHDLLEVIDRVRKEGEVRGFELTIPDIKHTRYVEVNAAAVRDPQGQREEIILIFHDYTRIKELEGIRKDFVANVSHELRTPLTLVKGYVETLIDGAKDDPAVATKFLQTIQRHANRLTFLIEDLLTISQLESGRVVMQPQPLLLHPLVERVLDELQSHAAQRKVMMENTVSAGQQVGADSDRLQQVLYNLVDNAIKYGRPGGTICIGAENKESTVQLWVRDDGPGIPPEACERVFERFYRVDRARSREQGGTGLGLAIVKHIVQSHGGEVWVESVLEHGCTFYFTLPKAVSTPPALQ